MPWKGRRIGPRSVFKQVQRKLFKGVFGAFGRLLRFLRLSLENLRTFRLLWSLLEVLLAPQGPSWGPLGTFGVHVIFLTDLAALLGQASPIWRRRHCDYQFGFI